MQINSCLSLPRPVWIMLDVCLLQGQQTGLLGHCSVCQHWARVPRHCQISWSQDSSCIRAGEEAVTLQHFWCACQTTQKTTGNIQHDWKWDHRVWKVHPKGCVFQPSWKLFQLVLLQAPVLCSIICCYKPNSFNLFSFTTDNTQIVLNHAFYRLWNTIPNISMQEKYFLPFRLQPFSCFNECTDLHICHHFKLNFHSQANP